MLTADCSTNQRIGFPIWQECSLSNTSCKKNTYTLTLLNKILRYDIMDDSKHHLIASMLARRNINLSKLRSSAKPAKYNNRTSQANLENHRKGVAFEKYIVDLFNSDYFTLIEWRSDKKTTEGIFTLMSIFPDLEFYYEAQTESLQFAVECKWREHFYRESITLKEEQLRNYRHYEQVTGNPTFVVVGVGNTPEAPANLYIIPLSDIDCNKLHEFSMRLYLRADPRSNFFLDCKTPRLI